MTMKKNNICFCLLISLLLLSGCCCKSSTTVQHTPKNFHQVSQEIYRCGQPTKKEMSYLVEEHGIKSVLNLRKHHSDKDEIENLNITLHEIPLAAGSLTEDDILLILKTIKNAPKPILIHCWHGSDRTGAAVAASRIVFEDWSVEDAIEELKRDEFGHHETIYPNIPELLRAIDWPSMKKALEHGDEKSTDVSY